MRRFGLVFAACCLAACEGGGDAGLLGGRLLALELAGLVEQLPGGRVQRVCR